MVGELESLLVELRRVGLYRLIGRNWKFSCSGHTEYCYPAYGTSYLKARQVLAYFIASKQYKMKTKTKTQI